jgi:site-specific recombinase XerD
LCRRSSPDAGEHARAPEFVAATLRNKHTRTAYLHAVNWFFGWCEHHQLGQLADIEPLHVAAYIEALGKDFENLTVKQHLAAIRMLFDWLGATRRCGTSTALWSQPNDGNGGNVDRPAGLGLSR